MVDIQTTIADRLSTIEDSKRQYDNRSRILRGLRVTIYGHSTTSGFPKESSFTLASLVLLASRLGAHIVERIGPTVDTVVSSATVREMARNTKFIHALRRWSSVDIVSDSWITHCSEQGCSLLRQPYSLRKLVLRTAAIMEREEEFMNCSFMSSSTIGSNEESRGGIGRTKFNGFHGGGANGVENEVTTRMENMPNVLSGLLPVEPGPLHRYAGYGAGYELYDECPDYGPRALLDAPEVILERKRLNAVEESIRSRCAISRDILADQLFLSDNIPLRESILKKLEEVDNIETEQMKAAYDDGASRCSNTEMKVLTRLRLEQVNGRLGRLDENLRRLRRQRSARDFWGDKRAAPRGREQDWRVKEVIQGQYCPYDEGSSRNKRLLMQCSLYAK